MAKTADTVNCTIGEGSTFDGKFHVNGSILIEGKFNGDIRTDEQLIVGQSGKVKTDVTAKRVVIAGTIIGNVRATEEVNLLQTGKILGDISTPKLIVEPGAITQGKVTITAEHGSDDIQTIIEESFGQDASAIFNDIKKEKKAETVKGKSQD